MAREPVRQTDIRICSGTAEAVQDLEPCPVRVDLENRAVADRSPSGHPVSVTREGEGAVRKSPIACTITKLCRTWNPVPSVFIWKIVPGMPCPSQRGSRRAWTPRGEGAVRPPPSGEQHEAVQDLEPGAVRVYLENRAVAAPSPEVIP